MPHLTKEQREFLQRSLDERAGILREEITGALRATDTSQGIHLANHFEEVDDAALANLEASLDIAALERDRRELRQVQDAIRRMQLPEFGACEDCSADIAFARLSAEPAATRCVSCQAAYEHAHFQRNTL